MLSSITDLVNTSPIPVWWSLYHYPNIARRRRKFFRVLLCKHTVRCRSDSWWSLIRNCSFYICAAGEIFWSIHYMHIIWAPQAKIFWGCDTNLQILKGLYWGQGPWLASILTRVWTCLVIGNLINPVIDSITRLTAVICDRMTTTLIRTYIFIRKHRWPICNITYLKGH